MHRAYTLLQDASIKNRHISDKMMQKLSPYKQQENSDSVEIQAEDIKAQY